MQADKDPVKPDFANFEGLDAYQERQKKASEQSVNNPKQDKFAQDPHGASLFFITYQSTEKHSEQKMMSRTFAAVLLIYSKLVLIAVLPPVAPLDQRSSQDILAIHHVQEWKDCIGDPRLEEQLH